jgi:hypothetical protein
MSQQSEERLPESTSADAGGPPGARILHLKTRQTDLQQAIRQRAQESLERERDLDQEARRPKPLKWLIIATIAAIPAVLTMVAVDGFLRAIQKYMAIAVATQPQGEPAQAAPEGPLQSNEPGVVLLQPLAAPPIEAQAPAEAQPAEPATTPRN